MGRQEPGDRLLSLRYELSFHRDRLGRSFYSLLPPFEAPDDPALFFEWLWDELFPGENYRLEDPDAYRVEHKYEAPNRIKFRPLDESGQSQEA